MSTLTCFLHKYLIAGNPISMVKSLRHGIMGSAFRGAAEVLQQNWSAQVVIARNA